MRSACSSLRRTARTPCDPPCRLAAVLCERKDAGRHTSDAKMPSSNTSTRSRIPIIAVWLVITFSRPISTKPTIPRSSAKASSGATATKAAPLSEHVDKGDCLSRLPARCDRGLALYRAGRLERPDEHGRLQGQGRLRLARRGHELCHDALGRNLRQQPARPEAAADLSGKRPSCAQCTIINKHVVGWRLVRTRHHR